MKFRAVALLIALTLALLAGPFAAGGQTPGNVRRVGIIHQGGPDEGVVDRLRQGLRELGLEEGKNKAVEEAARDLERGNVDLI
jgi:hypothetical protein